MVERLRIAALLSEVTGLHLQFSFMNKIIDLKSTAEELLKLIQLYFCLMKELSHSLYKV